MSSGPLGQSSYPVTLAALLLLRDRLWDEIEGELHPGGVDTSELITRLEQVQQAIKNHMNEGHL